VELESQETNFDGVGGTNAALQCVSSGEVRVGKLTAIRDGADV